jgi:hypothetical protein
LSTGTGNSIGIPLELGVGTGKFHVTASGISAIKQKK